MQHKVKVTVIDKKLYPELQHQYCADPNAGACPCYHIGDTFIFERYGTADDFWHMGQHTLTQSAYPAHTAAGGSEFPHCSEAWDAIARYIYTGLQGGSIMRGWMSDERVMIACCSDGTRPVIFKIQRMDYQVLYLTGMKEESDCKAIRQELMQIDDVTDVRFTDTWTEVFVEKEVREKQLRQAVAAAGAYSIQRID